MKAKNAWILVLAAALLLFLVSASASMLIPANDKAKENASAPEHSPVISEGWELEKIDFVHYAKPENQGAARAAVCYKLMGVKWSTLPVNYDINPSNPQGLSESFVTTTVSSSAETWDSATSRELFNDAFDVNYAALYGVQDYQNAIAFGDYANDNVIAVTSVWYIPRGKRIVEFDMLFNTRFSWGDATIEPTAMDLQNIATHELGHSVGLADLYNSTCSAVTMFGYSSYGETSKRTLEQPDITGLQKMYGA